jgi:death-on-curing protein
LELVILPTEAVIRVHEMLVREFANTEDPISPPGVASEHLLESAVSRQYTSLGQEMKYETKFASAATLFYGLCCDHPFHNGNKRTALVSMLLHLDRNRLTTAEGVHHNHLYKLVLDTAQHNLGPASSKKSRGKVSTTMLAGMSLADYEVAHITKWLRNKTRAIARGERNITYRELRRILLRHGVRLADPENNYINVIAPVKEPIDMRGRKERTVEKRVARIPYPGESREVGVNIMKLIRRNCKLDSANGVDSIGFYDEQAVTDGLITTYRMILRKLAHV